MRFFKKLWVVVINLDSRDDRLYDLKKHMNKHNIDIVRYPAICDPNMTEEIVSEEWANEIHARIYKAKPQVVKMSIGERCCSMSHFNIWNILLHSRGSCIFIVEDDIRLVDDFEYYLNFYSDFLPKDWDIFCLDFMHMLKPEKYNDFIFKAKYFYHTGAYIINYRCVKKIMNYLPIDAPLDHYLSKLTYYNIINIYMPSKPLATQTKSDSDIEHT